MPKDQVKMRDTVAASLERGNGGPPRASRKAGPPCPLCGKPTKRITLEGGTPAYRCRNKAGNCRHIFTDQDLN